MKGSKQIMIYVVGSFGVHFRLCANLSYLENSYSVCEYFTNETSPPSPPCTKPHSHFLHVAYMMRLQLKNTHMRHMRHMKASEWMI